MRDADGARAYPARPVAGVGAVVLTADHRVVLVRRGQPPLAGSWSLPGGVLELGETLSDAVVREVREETGLVVEAGPLIDLFEHVARDDDGRVRYHYVIADYLCHARHGNVSAGSDAIDATTADLSDLERFDLAARALDMIRRACVMAGIPAPAPRESR